MREIKLYDLNPTLGNQTISLPYGAQVIKADLYDGKHLGIWAVISITAKYIDHRFWIYKDKEVILDGPLMYIDTYKRGGKWNHLFMEADDGFKPLISKLPQMDLSEHGGSSVKF